MNRAFYHHTTSNLAEFWRVEHITHFRNTNDFFTQFGSQQASHRLFHVVEQIVDHAVITHVQSAVFNDTPCGVISTNIKAEDNRAGSNRQGHVRFGNTANTGRYNVHLHFVRCQLLQGRHNGFQRTANISLQHNVEHGLGTFAHATEQGIQFGCLLMLMNLLLGLVFTIFSHFTGFFLVFNHHEAVTSIWCAIQTQNLNRNRWASGINRFAVFVQQGTSTTITGACQYDIAFLQRTVLYQHGSYRTTSLVETGFDDDTASRALKVCFQFKNFSL